MPIRYWIDEIVGLDILAVGCMFSGNSMFPSAPPSHNYGHEQTWHDGNRHSHLQATLLGPSLTVPIAEGKLVLGTWQQVFHLECDVRGRQRTLVVTVVGD